MGRLPYFAKPSSKGSCLRNAAVGANFMNFETPSPTPHPPDIGGALHDYETGPLQMLNKPLGDDLGHDLVGVVDPIPAVVAERKRQRRGEVARACGRQLVGGVRHAPG